MAECAVSVSVRVRPLSKSETPGGSAWSVDAGSNAVRAGDGSSDFSFDRVFGSDVSNHELYAAHADRLVRDAVGGYNACIFAYGQTASGKTHTMRGSSSDAGVAPRAVEQVFALAGADASREYLFRVSYLELYNERINDLLQPDNTKLSVHETAERGVFVAGLAEEIVTDCAQVLRLMDVGDRNRRVGETQMNARSSRSHSIFRVVIESRDVTGEDEVVRVSTLYLTDLAGSERVAKTGAEGIRAKEGAHINKSLLTLGVVINRLTEQTEGSGGGAPKPKHVPYRDSLLTRILQPSLGGNSRTAVICNVTPAAAHADETLSTLRFAARVKRVKNHAVVNETASEDAALLKRQANEIERLRAELAAAGGCGEQPASSAQVEADVMTLRRNLLQQEASNMHMSLLLEAEKEAKAEKERTISEQQRKIQNLTNLMLKPERSVVPSAGGTKRSSRRATCAYLPSEGGAAPFGRPLVTLAEDHSDGNGSGSCSVTSSEATSLEQESGGANEDAGATSALTDSTSLDGITSARLAFLEDDRKRLKGELEAGQAALTEEKEAGETALAAAHAALEASELERRGLQASLEESEARLQEWKAADDELDDDCTVRIELRTSLEAQEAELKRLRPLESEVEALRLELASCKEELAGAKERLTAETARADESAEAAAQACGVAEDVEKSARADLKAAAIDSAQLTKALESARAELKESTERASAFEQEASQVSRALEEACASSEELRQRADAAEAALKQAEETNSLEGDAANKAMRAALKKAESERERADQAEVEIEGMHDELVELREAARAHRSDGANVIAELSAAGELARIEAAKARESLAMLEERLDGAMQGCEDERQRRVAAEEKIEELEQLREDIATLEAEKAAAECERDTEADKAASAARDAEMSRTTLDEARAEMTEMEAELAAARDATAEHGSPEELSASLADARAEAAAANTVAAELPVVKQSLEVAEDELDETKKQLEEAQAETGRLRGELSERDASLARASERLTAVENAYTSKSDELELAQKLLEESAEAANQSREEIEALEESLKSAKRKASLEQTESKKRLSMAERNEFAALEAQATAEETANKLSELEERYAELSAQLEVEAAKAKAAEEHVAELKAGPSSGPVKALKAEIAALKKAQDAAGGPVVSLRKENVSLRKEVGKVTREKDEHQDKVRELMREKTKLVSGKASVEKQLKRLEGQLAAKEKVEKRGGVGALKERAEKAEEKAKARGEAEASARAAAEAAEVTAQAAREALTEAEARLDEAGAMKADLAKALSEERARRARCASEASTTVEQATAARDAASVERDAAMDAAAAAEERAAAAEATTNELEAQLEAAQASAKAIEGAAAAAAERAAAEATAELRAATDVAEAEASRACQEASCVQALAESTQASLERVEVDLQATRERAESAEQALKHKQDEAGAALADLHSALARSAAEAKDLRERLASTEAGSAATGATLHEVRAALKHGEAVNAESKRTAEAEAARADAATLRAEQAAAELEALRSAMTEQNAQRASAAEQALPDEASRVRATELEEANRTLRKRLDKAEATVAKMGALKQQYMLLKSKLQSFEQSDPKLAKAAKARKSVPASIVARGVLRDSVATNQTEQ